MNILMLGRWVPPPRRAVRGTREYQFARHLARSHRLTLAFITDTSDIAGSISALRGEFGDLEFASVPRGWKSLASAVRLATGESCTLSYFRSEALRTRLRDRLRRTQYDLVLVSSSSMIQYAMDVDPAIPLVVDFASVGSEWWMEQAARGTFPSTRFFRTEALRLRTAEAAAAGRAGLCVAESSKAAGVVEALRPGAHVVVIPSGVDIEAFPSVRPLGKVPTVVFTTSLADGVDPSDLIEFCRDIVPAVRARVPHARFIVASKDGTPGAGASSALAGIEVISAGGGDSRLLYHDRTVAVAPLHAGADIRNSVLEPMAAGVPVVTTSSVKVHLTAQDGRDLVVADSSVEFAQRVVELLERSSSREEIGAHGRKLVGFQFSWEASGRYLEQLVSGVGKKTDGSNTATDPGPVRAIRGG